MPSKSELATFEPVRASLKFLAGTDGAGVYRVGENNQQNTRHEGEFHVQEVEIKNARAQSESFQLDKQGFTLVPQPTQVKDFYNDEELKSIYNSEVKNLVQMATGASRVEIFDHTRRSASNEVRAEHDVREPASVIHNDYTAASGVNRLRDHFADTDENIDDLLSGRFAIVNVWRSINGPILSSPLALCDAQTSGPDDFVSVKRVAKDRVGELQQALYNPAQEWYYYPEMQFDEALLIKTFDSSEAGPTRFTFHTSFQLPASDGKVPARESLETRCFVFYDAPSLFAGPTD